MNGSSFNVAYLFLQIYNFFNWLVSGAWLGSGSTSPSSLTSSFHTLIIVLKPLGTFIWLALAAGIIYCLIRIEQIRRLEKEKMTALPMVAAAPVQNERPGVERWQQVLAKVGSQNPADWRVAILEADIILDEALGEQGYSGTLGEKLQSIPKSKNFPLDAAWEAHKVRNAVAHEGAGFDLTERDAKRATGFYQLVLESLRYI